MTDQTQTDTTNTPEHDARIKREDALAEQGREQRSVQAKAKREAKPAAKAPPAKPAAKAPAKREGSMAEFVDGLLIAGTTWTALEERAKAEAGKRKITTVATLGALKAHVKFKSKQAGWKVTETKGTVKMEKVEKPKAKPAKPATGKQVTKQTENGRQTVTSEV